MHPVRADFLGAGRCLARLSHALKTQDFKDSFKGDFMMKEPRYQESDASALKLCDLVGRLVSRHR